MNHTIFPTWEAAEQAYEEMRDTMQAIVASFDAPTYGDREAQIDHVFDALLSARALLNCKEKP